MVGEKFAPQIPRNAIKTHEIFMFDKNILSNSIMVGGIFENLKLKMTKNEMKSCIYIINSS